MSDDKHVVIFNYGHGRTSMWPNSEKPGVYSKADAEKHAESAKSSGFHSRAAIHVKPLSKAHEYISGLELGDTVKRLQKQHGVVKESNMQTFKEFNQLIESMAVHAYSLGGGKFKVHKVGSSVKHVKVGDEVTSSDLDDLADAGHKVKETKRPKQ